METTWFLVAILLSSSEQNWREKLNYRWLVCTAVGSLKNTTKLATRWHDELSSSRVPTLGEMAPTVSSISATPLVEWGQTFPAIILGKISSAKNPRVRHHVMLLIYKMDGVVNTTRLITQRSHTLGYQIISFYFWVSSTWPALAASLPYK